MSGERLGRFEVLRRLGAGGMGEVWAARHLDLGAPVAVKVITARRAGSERYRQAFADEVRAVAGLRHRGVLEVLDHGTAGPGPWEGSPYLVMALAEGSLAEAPPRAWPEIRGVLLEVLEALAHAHAHGVVHLDLKPANLLRVGGRVALADFGVAAFAGEALTRDAVRGSAAYMAPEQFAGRWRDYGPWTDLYALGTVAWELLCGDLPFPGTDATTLGNLKRAAAPPRLPEGLAPEALADWLETLLATSAHDRFARAADAAAALAAVPASAELNLRRRGTAGAAATLSVSTLSEATLDLWLDAPPRAPTALPRAPFPDGWRSAAIEPALLREPLGAGLLALRPPPFVGREAERDRLWAALRRARDTNRPVVTVVEGPEGAGATALCDWVAARADELGAARAVIAAPGERPADLWRRALGLTGLDRDDAIAHLTLGRHRVDEAVARSVAALVTGARLTAAERVGVQVALLEALAVERPVALALDDLAAEDSPADLVHALASRARAAVWVTVTVRSERRVEDPAVAAQVARLEAAGADRIALGPLSDGETRTLVERWLALDGAASFRLVELAAGNPAVARRALVRWLDAGALAAGPAGFALRGEPPPEAAGDAEARLGWVEPAQRPLLERAAALGDFVPRGLWSVDEPEARALEDALLRRGLAVPSPGGWSFAHPDLRQALIAGSRAAGTWVGHHRWLADRVQAVGPPHAWRRGEHLFEAEAWEEAVEVLLDQVIVAWGQVHVSRVRAFVHKARLAADRVADPPSWHRRVAGVEALFAVWGGRYDDAIRVAEAVIAEGADHRAVARALRARGMALQLRGELARASEDLGRAAAMVDAEGDVDLACEINVARMHALTQQGRLVEAREVADRFVAHSARQQASAEAARAILATYEGDFEGSLPRFRHALGVFRDLGYRVAAAGVSTNLGDALRHLGRLEEAEAPLREAIEVARQHGLGSEPVMRLNLVQLLIARGRDDDAWDELQVALADLERIGRRALLGAAHAVALRLVARRGDWDRWDHHERRATELVAETGLDEPEVAEALAEAHRLAAARAPGPEAG